VKVGTEFIIGFIGQKGQLIRVQCSAHRCEAGGTGGTQYVVGAVFQEMLAEEQEDAKPAPVEAAPAERPAGRMFRRELPPQEAEPVAQAEPADQELAEEEPASQAEPIAEVEPEPVAAPAEVKPEPIAQAPIFSEEAVIMTLSESSSGTPAEHAQACHNQEILARVKAAVTKQNQSLKQQVQQLEETNRQLAGQQAAMNELSHKVQDLQGKLAQSVLLQNEERQKAAHATHEAEASVRELAELRQTVKALQAKSEADDKAIAELAGFFGAESSGPQSAPRATAEAA
jgi:myosin heavy subunit